MSLDTTRRMFATVTGTTATYRHPDGRLEQLAATPGDDIRQVLLQRTAFEAQTAGVPVELHTTGDRGEHHLLIDVDGTVEPAEPPDARPEARPLQHETEGMTESPRPQAHANHGAAEPPARPSFIETSSSTPPGAQPRFLERLGVRPSRVAQQRRADEVTVSQHWAGCRTLAVANGKGGVGKTMTTAMLSAVFARFGGGSVLAWDNNDTRGTLGWRTEAGPYDTTIKDLLPAAHRLLAPSAGVAEIAQFVHHQPDDRYDVLRSNPELLATHQRLSSEEFDLLMQVAARYYRLVIFDSGNDESSDRWLRMVDNSYQLVIPTLAVPESAESAALLLEALRERDGRSRFLADHAVIIVTEAERNPGAADRIIEGFKGGVRAVARIPFDPALKSGPLRLDAVRPVTRRAWIHAASAAAQGL